MQQLGLTSNCFCVDSCGLHDLQSVLRYSILNFIGAGGLDGDNAVQRLHTMYSFYIENRRYWSDIIQSRESIKKEKDMSTVETLIAAT